MKWFDLSHPISEGMPVFPGDPVVSVSRVLKHQTNGIQLSQITLGSHTGTHLDVPRHFLESGAAVDDLPIDLFSLPAHVLAVEPSAEGVIDLSNLDLNGSQSQGALLLSTGWEKRWGQHDYFSACPVFAEGTAEILLQAGVNMFGVDLPTVSELGHPEDPNLMHVKLLGAGIILVENLTNLAGLIDLTVEFFAFPLKFAGGDGSPVRAVARC
jgi:kynurenine formamidase